MSAMNSDFLLMIITLVFHDKELGGGERIMSLFNKSIDDGVKWPQITFTCIAPPSTLSFRISSPL